MYDLREIKALPIGDVARKYGIHLKEKGDRLWGSLREGDKTASFSINVKKNLWYDFGSGKGGSVIDLVAEIEGISATEAINRLAEDFGFKSEKTAGWRHLTDRQYKDIGIQPERATMNFSFDLDKHSVDQLSRWSNKYGMPVKDLAEKYPKVYNEMISKIAVDHVKVLRDAYQARITMYHDPSLDQKTRNMLKIFAQKDSEEIDRKIQLIGRALKPLYDGQKFDLSHLKVNPQMDFDEKNIGHRAISPEDQKMRDHIVKVYKQLFGFKQIDHFTVDQVKALHDVNKSIVKTDNQYISIPNLKKAYEKLGENLEQLEKQYKDLVNEGRDMRDRSSDRFNDWKERVTLVENQLSKVKDLFSKCNLVIEGVRNANLSIKADELKAQNPVKSMDMSMDISQ